MAIEKRRRVYYALLDIPKDVRGQFEGKPRFVRSLKTDDRQQAELRASALILQWKRAIDVARGNSPAGIDGTTAFWRDAIAGAKTAKERETLISLADSDIADQAVSTAHRLGLDLEDPEDADTFDQTKEAAQLGRKKKLARGELHLILDYLEPWEAWLKANGNKPRTILMKLSTVRGFAEKFPHVEDIARANLQEWVEALRAKDGVSWTTIKRKKTELVSLWDFLVRSNKVSADFDPFRRLRLAPSKREAAGKEREQFEAKDVLRLRRAAFDGNDAALGNTIWIAMYSGARLGEVCGLMAEHVHADHFSIVDGKTKAAARKVPIHPLLAPVMRNLKKASKGGYLIVVDSKNRSDTISKRFGRLCEDVGGFSEMHVFHSLRHTVAQLLKNVGVAEDMIGALLGHEGKTMVGGVYTDNNKVPVAVKATALAKLNYGERKRSIRKKPKQKP